MEGLTKVWGELWLYFSFADHMAKGQLPYIDFFPEYPPYALFFFKLANSFGEQYFTLLWYAIILFFLIATFLIIRKMGGKAWLFMSTVLVLGGLLFDRFDVIPAFFSLFTIYLMKRGYTFIGYWFFAVAVLTKIYPIVLLPYIFFLPKRGRVCGLLVFIGYMATTFYLWHRNGATEGLKRLLDFHSHRGIQIESLKAMPYLMDKDTIVEYKHNTFEVRK